jgi:hypothetical protein
VPAQPVDATPPKLLIPKCFLTESRSCWLCSTKPLSQRGFSCESAQRTTLSHRSPHHELRASSKIPEGEAQFTHEQLEQYYVVYKNSAVRYLRSLFDGYVNSSGGTEQERQVLSKWDKAYFRSKFIVMSRDLNTFGGTLITILFQDRPDKVFVAWVYPEGSDKKLALRKLEAGNFSEEDIRRITVRYKKLIVEPPHCVTLTTLLSRQLPRADRASGLLLDNAA